MEKVSEKVIYRLTEQEVKEHPLCAAHGEEGFYDFILRELGIEGRVDCRHIDIALNIQDSWYEYAEAQGWDKFSFTMTLLNIAPKVNDSLADNEVLIDEKFIIAQEENEKEEN